MRRLFLVAQREYLQNVRTKGFWFGILFFPVMLTAFIAVPQLLERAKSVRRYAVIDESGWLLRAVNDRIAANDLRRVLDEAASEYGRRTDAWAVLPPALQESASTLAGLSNEERLALAQAILSGGDGNGLPPAAMRMHGAYGGDVRAWWDSVPREQLRRIGSDFSFARYEQVPAPEGLDPQAELTRQVSAGDLFAYIVLEADPVAGAGASRYVSNNLTDEDLRGWFGNLASNEVRQRRLAQERIDPSVARWIQAPVRFEVRKVTASGEEEAIGSRDTLRQWAPVVFVYLLWISVFSVSQMLMMNTVEEKSSRVIEVLLSSVSPVELLAGKIAGIAGTGLTMVLSWLVALFLGTKYLPGFFGAPADLGLSAIASDPLLIGSFLAYFLLGYLFFAAILVGLGSVCNTVSDAQNMMPAIMLILFVPLLSMVPIGRDPNGTLAHVLSYIPPFTPFVMMNRAAGPPTALEYVLTTLLLLVSIGAALWAGAKVFRIGILLTGKPPRIREILRWVRAPVGSVPVRKETA